MTDWTKSSCALCGSEIGLGAKSMVIRKDGLWVCTDCDKKIPKCKYCHHEMISEDGGETWDCDNIDCISNISLSEWDEGMGDRW